MKTKAIVLSILCGMALSSYTPDAAAQSKTKPWKKEKTEKKAEKIKRERDYGFNGEAVLVAEWMPAYKNGKVEKYQSWVQSQVIFPEAVKQQGIEGTVAVAFVVTSSGEVRGMEVLRTPHERLGQEVIRVMKLSGKWRPGYDADGNPVNVRMTIAVNFKLR